MTLDITFPLILALMGSGLFAGVLGALVGIGGGIIVVPVLTLGFGIDIKIAVAASLVAVVASSTAAGSVYVGKGLANMRLGMILEIATTLGGITGGLIAVYIAAEMISVLFSVLMVVTAVLILRAKDQSSIVKKKTEKDLSSISASEQIKDIHESKGYLSGSYYDSYLKSQVYYQVTGLPLGSAVSFLAGILSGLLGVGGGFLKVPAMTLLMKAPMKVSTATSNLMIGVTAISSLFVYFTRGLVYPMIAAPVAIGVVAGALYGTTLAQKISPKLLRKIFAVILVFVALQMSLKSLGVSFG